MSSFQAPTIADLPTLSVIAPCLNEEGNVDLLADRMLLVFDGMRVPAELILVDDGSTDETWRRITDRSARDPRVRGVRHASNQGIESAWRSGLEASGAHLVCLIDADLQNQPEDVPRLYQAYLEDVPDLVQGVRHPATSVRRRRWFSRALNFVLNTTFGMNLRDNKSGFILTRREVMMRLLEHRHSYRYFQSFIGVAAGVRGFIIREVDTTFAPRHAGRSFLSSFPILVSFRILWELARFRAETWQVAAGNRVSSTPATAVEL